MDMGSFQVSQPQGHENGRAVSVPCWHLMGQHLMGQHLMGQHLMGQLGQVYPNGRVQESQQMGQFRHLPDPDPGL